MSGDTTQSRGETTQEPPFLDVAPVDPRYACIKAVFDDAYAQVANGKGAERHGTSDRFEDQPTMEIIRALGIGGPLFQACKKAMEAARLLTISGWWAARREILGAMAYCAIAVVAIDEKLAAGEMRTPDE